MARQLNATEPWDISGPAGALIGRAAHFVSGVTSGGSLPGGGLMSKMIGGGGAAEGAAGAAEGIGAVAEEAAPLLLAGA